VAKRIGAVAYLECSAKTGEGVSEVFQLAGKIALQRRKSNNGKGCIVV
jgi:Ras family protein A